MVKQVDPVIDGMGRRAEDRLQQQWVQVETPATEKRTMKVEVAFEVLVTPTFPVRHCTPATLASLLASNTPGILPSLRAFAPATPSSWNALPGDCFVATFCCSVTQGCHSRMSLSLSLLLPRPGVYSICIYYLPSPPDCKFQEGRFYAPL